MEVLIPWERLLEQIRPSSPKAGKGRGPYGLESMLRVDCVQLFCNLSDPASEDMLHEIERVGRFTGISLEKMPEERTIPNFRHLLERQGWRQVLFESIKDHLSEEGLMLKEAPASRKKRKRERDPEMKQTGKGNQWHVVIKLHVGVNAQNGLVHSQATTSATVHDLTASEQYSYSTERKSVSGEMRVAVELRSGRSIRIATWHGRLPWVGPGAGDELEMNWSG